MNPDMVPLDEDEDEAPLAGDKRSSGDQEAGQGASQGALVGGSTSGYAGEEQKGDDGQSTVTFDAPLAVSGGGGDIADLPPMRSRADTLKLPLTSEGA